jgi:hypothetical protein
MQILPRRFDETSTVQVMLMRKLCYNAPYMYEVVRPLMVYNAAKYLATTELYKNEGVVLSDAWANAKDGDAIDYVVDDIKQDDGDQEIHESLDTENEADADDEQIDQETLVISDEDRSGLIHRIAPGEGKRPLSLLRDLDAEVLSFPKIYAGIRRQFKKGLKITYTDIAKSEARRFRVFKHQSTLYYYSDI